MDNFVTETLSKPRPEKLQEIDFPRRKSYYPSPTSWENEVLYFCLPDRFSDENTSRPLLDRKRLWDARKLKSGKEWRWEDWKTSGWRFQGGTIQGIINRLGYLAKLGITAIWVGPVFKQRAHLDTYHGYGIQDFLDVDPRFGTRAGLVELVKSAHGQGIRVILDIVFNHSGSNFEYCVGTPDKVCSPPTPGVHEAQYISGNYQCINWLDKNGDPLPDVSAINGPDDGVWPKEFQDNKYYTKAGTFCFNKYWEEGNINDPAAPHKRTDFYDLRDFSTPSQDVLTNLARVYQYWIALTDCDGFRLDTMKHVTWEEGKNFCGAIKEFAANLGKEDFFLVAEVAGGDYNEHYYLDALGQNLNAALDIGDLKPVLNGVAKGLTDPNEYFSKFYPGAGPMGSHRELRNKHVSILEQHDDKRRFTRGASSDHQTVAGTAIQLFTLGIPCIYYGTEQGFAGPEASEWQWLRSKDGSEEEDIYTREAMFGPENPRKHGNEGLQAVDDELPGFGPFGTSGHHCFDETHPAYVRIAALTEIRKNYPVLRHGRQYMRSVSLFDESFNNSITYHRAGEIVAWSRILFDEEALIIVNSNGNNNRGGNILVDAKLCPPESEMTVIANTEEAATPDYTGPYKAGSTVKVKRRDDGNSYIEIGDVKPSEVIILSNHP